MYFNNNHHLQQVPLDNIISSFITNSLNANVRDDIKYHTHTLAHKHKKIRRFNGKSTYNRHKSIPFSRVNGKWDWGGDAPAKKKGRKRTTTEANKKSLCQKANKCSKATLDEEENQKIARSLAPPFICLFARSFARSIFPFIDRKYQRIILHGITFVYQGLLFPFFSTHAASPPLSPPISSEILFFFLFFVGNFYLTSHSLHFKDAVSPSNLFSPLFAHFSISIWIKRKRIPNSVAIETAANFKGHFNQ